MSRARALPNRDHPLVSGRRPPLALWGANHMWLGLGALYPKWHSALAAIAPTRYEAGAHEGVDGRNRVKPRALSPAVHRLFFPRLRGRETICGACFTPCLAGSLPPLPIPRAGRSIEPSGLYLLRAAARLVLQLEPGVSSYSTRCSNPGGALPPRALHAHAVFFLPWPYAVSWFGKPFACWSAVTVGYGATRWGFWCDAGGEERVLHLRWWKAAFGIIVERAWRSLDGTRVGESEGMPRWTWMRVHLRGGRHASAARSEAAMTTTGLEPIMPMLYALLYEPA